MRLLKAALVSLLFMGISAQADTEVLRNYLWMPCFSSNNVYKVNIMTHEVAAIILVGGGPAGVAVGPYSVYITCRYSSKLYCISKSDDVVTDSIDLSSQMAFGIGVALDTRNQIYVVGRLNSGAYDMDAARLIKLSPDGSLLSSLNLPRVQGNGVWEEWNHMSVIGIAIDEPEIMIPWQRSWDVNTGISITDTTLSDFQNFPLNPYIYGYRGPGASYDLQDRGWSSGDREGANYLISHRLPGYWRYYVLGNWGSSGQIYGDVAVDNSGYIWTGSALGYLMRFDPISCQTTSFYMGNQVKGIAVDRFSYIWVALYPLNALKKFDSDGNVVGNPVYVGDVPLGFGDMTGHEYGRRMTDVNERAPLPNVVTILKAYPNPFNAATTISYSLAAPGRVTISIYDLLGQKVAELHNGFQDSGYHTANWNAKDYNSSIYFAKLESANYSDNLKVVLIK